MYGSLEESTPAAAPALGPAEIKFVRKMMATSTGDDARPAGVLHEPQELSTSTLTKLEAASDEVELHGQFLMDREMRSSRYPDFYPHCSELYFPNLCGNTCCVPSNGTARAMAGG